MFISHRWGSECEASSDHNLTHTFMRLAQVRGLSCVSLLITPGACDGPGHLWLVDETGAYPVRAHCVGGGLRTDENDTTVANRLNSKLAASDFSTMTSQDGIRHLLGLLTGREDDAEKAGRREPLVMTPTTSSGRSSAPIPSRAW